MKGHLVIAILAVAAASCSGSGTNRALDPANELPFGHLDAPVDGAKVGSQVLVGGWAMDDHGIKEVRVYVDNHFVDAVANNTQRPDVSKAYPAYSHNTDMHGWTISISIDLPGPHTILAQAVDTNGATRDIGAVAITSHD
jgi:N-acetylmuramoyl-L-alanine amidase